MEFVCESYEFLKFGAWNPKTVRAHDVQQGCHNVASVLSPPEGPQMQLGMTHAVTTKPTTWKKVATTWQGPNLPYK